jgi:hypothetical protein
MRGEEVPKKDERERAMLAGMVDDMEQHLDNTRWILGQKAVVVLLRLVDLLPSDECMQSFVRD